MTTAGRPGAALQLAEAPQLARGSGCRPYYFVAIDSAGLAWRYPAQGVFQTTGEASCTQEWTP